MNTAVVIAWLAALGAGTKAVTIESDSSCPSAHAVEQAIAALGGESASRAASARVHSQDNRLIVEFGWPGAAQTERRELVVDSDCDGRAQSAAVVIASWLGILPAATLMPTPLGTPSAGASQATAASAAPAAPAPTPRPDSPPDVAKQPVEGDAIATEDAPTHQVLEDELPSRPRKWLGVGLLGSVGGGVAPGVRAEHSRAWMLSGIEVGWTASTFASMPRSKSLAGGTSSWLRPALGVAGMASVGGPRVRLALDIGLLAGLTVAWGSGYPSNHTDASPTWGVTAGLRLSIALTSSRLWAELRIVDWLQPESLQHEVQPTGIVRTVDLPAWEGFASLGWSFAIGAM